MTKAMTVHKKLTLVRAEGYEELFGEKPTEVFDFHRFVAADTVCLIDVFVYALEVEGLDRPVMAYTP